MVRFEVRFAHIGDLEEGADVEIAGRVVGEVESISVAGEGAVAHVSIEERYIHLAPRNAEIFVSSKGLLSDRYLAIGPPPEGQLPAPPIAPGDPPLVGVAPVLIENVILRSIENTRRFRDLLDAMAPEARAFADAIAELEETIATTEDRPGRYRDLTAGATRANAGAATLQERLAGAGRITDVADRAGRLAALVDRELESMDRDLAAVASDIERLRGAVPASSVVKLRLALAQTRDIAARLEAIGAKVRAAMAAIDRGEGTVGALLNDPEFINEAKELGKVLKRQPWRLIGTGR